jgi:putative hydrolase of the HAD superfamily
MENIKALIFDLDNTLLDRSKTFLDFTSKLVDKYFMHLPDAEKHDVIDVIVNTDQDGYKDKNQMFRELLECLPWEYKPLLEELLDFYTEEYVCSAILMEDALHLLEHYKTKYRLGLITNGRSIIQYGKIDKLNIRPYFDTIIVSEEAGIKKPDKLIFALALKHLDLKAEDCIYIGDHPVNDVDGAHQAGMKTIWMKVNQPWRDELTVQPLKTITKLSDLFGYIP